MFKNIGKRAKKNYQITSLIFGFKEIGFSNLSIISFGQTCKKFLISSSKFAIICFDKLEFVSL